jgi:hypothetical protein
MQKFCKIRIFNHELLVSSSKKLTSYKILQIDWVITLPTSKRIYVLRSPHDDKDRESI